MSSAILLLIRHLPVRIFKILTKMFESRRTTLRKYIFGGKWSFKASIPFLGSF